MKKKLVSLHYRLGFLPCTALLPSAQYIQGLQVPKLIPAKIHRASFNLNKYSISFAFCERLIFYKRENVTRKV